MTSRQLSEWQAYDVLEPIGEQRADYRMAVICTTLVNLAQSAWGKKGSFKPAHPEDFMPKWGGEGGKKQRRGQQTVEEMKDILKSIAKGSGTKRGVQRRSAR